MANLENHSIKKIFAIVSLVVALFVPTFVLAARTSIDWVNLSGTTYIQPNFPNGMDLLIFGTNHYINFNTVTGTSGYGLRDNGGTMEFKNSGGSWQGIGTGSGGGGGTFPFTPQTLGNATTTRLLLNNGLIAAASSTIGNGGANGGLTVVGNATSSAAQIGVLGAQTQFSSPLLNVGTSSDQVNNAPSDVISANSQTGRDAQIYLLNRSPGLGAYFKDEATNSDYVSYELRGADADYKFGMFGSANFNLFDSNNSKTPFIVENNTPTNTLYVAASGDVGFGTSTPNATVDDNGTLSIENGNGILLHASIGNNNYSTLAYDTTNSRVSLTWPLYLQDGLILGNVTGLTQCLHVNSVGTVSGTGSDCSSGGGTFPFTPTALGNSTSTLLQLNGGVSSTAASSSFSGQLHLTYASTTNLEMTMYVQDWPGTDLGAKFASAYAAAPPGTTFVISASTTQTTVMNMGTAGKQGTIKCSPGVYINWVGAATSTILNATNLGDLVSGWGIEGCTFRGVYGSGQIGIQIGGSNGGNGAVVENNDVQQMHIGLVTGANTWNINVDHNFFLDNDQAAELYTANNSGEGYRFSGGTFGDCRTNLSKCFNAEVNATDGMSMFLPVFDDGGVHLGDGNLDTSFFGPKFENPGADAGFGRYTYMSFDSGGFATVNIYGGTLMNGAQTQATSPWQFILNGARLNIYGTTVDNNTGNAVQISSFVNNYGGGTLSAYSWSDTNSGLATVATLATSSITYALDTSSGVIRSSLPYKIYPNGSVSSTAFLVLGEDAGGGATDIGAFDPNAGYFPLRIDANPLLLNAGSNSSVGIGTSSPFAKLSVATSPGASGAQQALFAIASSTRGTSTTTVFEIDHYGNATFQGFDPVGNVPIVTFQANSNAQLLFENLGGSALKLKAQDTKDRLVWCLVSSCSNNSDLYFDSDDSGTTRAFIQGSTGRVGIASTSPTALLSVAGTIAALLTTFATGDSAVCQRGVGGLLTVDSGLSSCIVSSMYTKNLEGDDSYAAAWARIQKLQVVEFNYKDTKQEDIGLFAEAVAKIDPRYAQYTSVARDVDGHHYNPGDPMAINWTAIQSDMIVVMQHQVAGTLGTAARSAEENWQWVAIALLALWNLYLTFRKKKSYE